MIIPRNLHPTEHDLWEKVCFAYNGKTYYGQINNTEGAGIHKKYKICSWINDHWFHGWVSASSILDERRTHHKAVLHDRRQHLFDDA